jgi:catechol 2,3-dioxygenase-like lactoylglutathione lyase family enzyme
MRKLQSQGVHHITLVGADRQTSIDFWEGVLGMPLIFEQPNLDRESESHLYFDPGDGRLITIFTNEERKPDPERTSTDPGAVHHIAFALSAASFNQTVERLDERGIEHSGVKDRGFMDSIYFEDPLGLLIELASYRFVPPAGFTHADVLLEAHKLRVERDDYNIDQVHLADAIEALVARSRDSLSEDRSPKDPYQQDCSRERGLEGDRMADNTLSILKPSVNNLSARVFVRAAGLDFDEIDMWGNKAPRTS